MAFHRTISHPLFCRLPAPHVFASCFLALLGMVTAVAAQQRQSLEALPAAGTAGAATYELSLAACAGSPCPFELRLTHDGAVRGQVLALSWPAAAPRAELADPDPLYGVGTPLTAPAALPRVWMAGQEQDSVTAAARTVPVMGAGKGARALLVTQMAGFEHPKRRHALYVADDQGPRLAWSYEEPQGPYQSWVLTPAGRAPVLLVRLHAPQDNASDRIEVRPLVWHAKRQVFTEASTAPRPALQAVVAGRYASVAAARAARARHGACLASYAVVRSSAAGAAERHALLQVAVDAAEAGAEIVRLRECAAGLRARTAPLAQWLAAPKPAQ